MGNESTQDKTEYEQYAQIESGNHDVYGTIQGRVMDTLPYAAEFRILTG